MNYETRGEWWPPRTWSHVLQCEVLIRKAASIDGLAPRAVVVGEVACLRTWQPPTHPRPTWLAPLRQRGQASSEIKTNKMIGKIAKIKQSLNIFCHRNYPGFWVVYFLSEQVFKLFSKDLKAILRQLLVTQNL
uniref:Uncharacterized protein n=1 Tax=Prolemur simus TaxID=1328070 RepID=A0A8C9DNQ4_PROSS